MPQYNFKTSDPDIVEFLKSVDNKSKTIVTALKEKRLNQIKPEEKKPLKLLSINKRKVMRVLTI